MNIERQYDTPFKTVVCFQYKYDDVGLRLEFPRSPALHAAFKNNSSTHPIPSQQNGHGMRRVPPGLIGAYFLDIIKNMHVDCRPYFLTIETLTYIHVHSFTVWRHHETTGYSHDCYLCDLVSWARQSGSRAGVHPTCEASPNKPNGEEVTVLTCVFHTREIYMCHYVAWIFDAHRSICMI